MPPKKNIKYKADDVVSVADPIAPDDAIEKEDFESSSEEDENDVPQGLDDNEQKDEDDDILQNKDYGDDDQREEPADEADGEYEQGDGDCLYKFTKKMGSDSEDEIDDDDGIFDDDAAGPKSDIIDRPEDRETKQVLTKYERVRILGDRAKQISLGAKPMLLNVDNLDPKEIARLELERGVIPFIIQKTLPDGTRERWKVSELKIIN